MDVSRRIQQKQTFWNSFQLNRYFKCIDIHFTVYIIYINSNRLCGTTHALQYNHTSICAPREREWTKQLEAKKKKIKFCNSSYFLRIILFVCSIFFVTWNNNYLTVKYLRYRQRVWTHVHIIYRYTRSRML